MRAVVFVGPSLPTARPVIPGLVYAPPAVRGDVIAAARSGVDVIGLVDGELFQRAAVTPREIRDAAAAGARLFGAASVGALRAVECPDAMLGIGEVYRMFRTGQLDGDDEVAMTYDPTDFRTIAYPLVNVRAALAAVVAAGDGTRAQADLVIGALRRLAFHRRDRVAVTAAAAAAALPLAPLLATLGSTAHDIKRRDALALIAALRRAGVS